jgi:hypothetical protein
MALEESTMDTDDVPEEASSATGSQNEGHWDQPRIALTFLALAAVIDLREIARKARLGEGSNQRNAEEGMVAMLDGIRRADHSTLPPKDVIEGSVSLLEDVLREHLESDYDNEWIALHAGCQDVAGQFASTLSEAADDFDRYWAELEREGSADPVVSRSTEGLERSVPHLRLAVSLAHKAGEPAAA